MTDEEESEEDEKILVTLDSAKKEFQTDLNNAIKENKKAEDNKKDLEKKRRDFKKIRKIIEFRDHARDYKQLCLRWIDKIEAVSEEEKKLLEVECSTPEEKGGYEEKLKEAKANLEEIESDIKEKKKLFMADVELKKVFKKLL